MWHRDLRRVVAVAVLVWVGPVQTMGQSRPTPVLAQVDQVVAGYVGSDTPGVAVLVMQDGRVLHMSGYGKADLASGTRVDPDSLFDLASVSKQMTALAVMLQMVDGLYTPDTPIGALLPEFAPNLSAPRPITVRDVLHHLAGLPDYLNDDPDLNYQAQTTNAEVIRWMARQPVDHKPGQRFDYSNSGFVVLASIAARADGVDSLAQVLRTRVWGPLGMQQVYLVGPVDPKHVVTGYAGMEGQFDPRYDPTVTEGDGNVFASLQDLARYEAAFTTDILLTAKDRDRLFQNGTTDDGRPIRDETGEGYGWGWGLGRYNGMDYASHSGSWPGTATYYQRNLTTGVTVIVLANGEDADVVGLAEAVEAVVPVQH